MTFEPEGEVDDDDYQLEEEEDFPSDSDTYPGRHPAHKDLGTVSTGVGLANDQNSGRILSFPNWIQVSS